MDSKWENIEDTVPSHTDEKIKSSSRIFKERFTPIDQHEHEKINSISSNDIDSEIHAQIDESIKRVSSSLANVARISRIKLAGIDQDEFNSFSKKKEDSMVQRERGSTKRSAILLEPSVFRRVSTGTFDTDDISTTHIRLSNNIPVCNVSFDPPSSKVLSIEQADNYANVIDTTLNQLELVKYTIPAKVNHEWDENYKTIATKYSDEDIGELQQVLYDDVHPILSNSFTMEKLQRDRSYIYNVLRDIAMELRLHRRYDCLENEIDSIVKIAEAQHNLEINYEIWSEQLSQLNELIVNGKNYSATDIKKLLMTVYESGAKIENAIFFCGSKLGHVEKWEQARLDQQKLLLEMEEQSLQDKLSECVRIEKSDDIISSELRVFLNADVAKLEGEIEVWSSRYNEEIDQHQRDIDYFNERIKDVKEALKEKYELRDKRQAIIDEYENAKREKAKEAEHWATIHHAATIIQSFWRGYMVRHQLGKYTRLRAKLKKRKKLAAKRRKKRKARLKKTAALKTTINR